MNNVIILAAGKGTRMRSAHPKVLQPIAGMPMLGHVLKTAKALQPSRIVVVVGHGSEQVSEYVQTQCPNATCVLQSPQLGTGHAVQVAMPHCDPNAPTTVVLYGDVPFITQPTLSNLIDQAQHSQVVLLTQTLTDPAGYGRIVRDANQHVLGIVEHRDATAEQLAICEVNTGIMAAQTQALSACLTQLSNHNAQAEYYLTDVVGIAKNSGMLCATTSPQHAFEVAGVNDRHQQADLERQWQLHQAKTLMQQGVHIIDPNRIDIRGTLACEQDVQIDIGCIFEGDVHLAAGTRIGPYCVLRNVRTAPLVQVQAFSHLDGAEVGPGAVVGPYARLRPGSQLGPNAHVGNFVELKNATLGANSKANHLSYIGDATVGERVNIGAGTITCNYDGANKHQTIIEDDVFIGSDTQLVAPVTVYQGATLGAGTTLTKNAPANALTLSRARQLTLTSWLRPKKTNAGNKP